MGPNAVEAMKMEFCLAIERAMDRNQLTQSQAAFIMKTSRSEICRVANKHLERLTLNRLVNYLARICPEFRFLLSIDHSLSSARPEIMTWQERQRLRAEDREAIRKYSRR